MFTFTFRVNGRITDQSGKMGGRLSSPLKIGIFGGLSVTAIVWFLLIKGLEGSTLMTPEVNEMISQNTWLIIGGSMAVFSVLMTLLSAMKLPVLKFVVLLGTFALAMAFAGLPRGRRIRSGRLRTFREAAETVFHACGLPARPPIWFFALAGVPQALRRRARVFRVRCSVHLSLCFSHYG